MGYSQNDKFEFAMRDARNAIGLGRGNALSKAVDLYCHVQHSPSGRSEEYMFKKIFKWADALSEFNRKRIESDYARWLKENGERIKMELGLIDRVIEYEKPMPLFTEKKGPDPDEEREAKAHAAQDRKSDHQRGEG